MSIKLPAPRPLPHGKAPGKPCPAPQAKPGHGVPPKPAPHKK
jgi:hypothetical protein